MISIPRGFLFLFFFIRLNLSNATFPESIAKLTTFKHTKVTTRNQTNKELLEFENQQAMIKVYTPNLVHRKK